MPISLCPVITKVEHRQTVDECRFTTCLPQDTYDILCSLKRNLN